MTQAAPTRIAALKKTPLFDDLTDKELRFLAGRAVVPRYQANELIFAEGDPYEGLYVIESGAIRIFKTSPAGRE